MAVTYAEGRILFTATGNSTEEPSKSIMVKGFNWTGATTTNTCVVDDQDDFELWNAKAETGGSLDFNYMLPHPIPVSQVKVTMGSGTLVVYI